MESSLVASKMSIDTVTGCYILIHSRAFGFRVFIPSLMNSVSTGIVESRCLF
jgi:hypothetical protein